jgi:hypothetical protein
MRSFWRMLRTCFSSARSVTTSSRAIEGVRATLGHELHHLALSRGQLVDRAAAGVSR